MGDIQKLQQAKAKRLAEIKDENERIAKLYTYDYMDKTKEKVDARRLSDIKDRILDANEARYIADTAPRAAKCLFKFIRERASDGFTTLNYYIGDMSDTLVAFLITTLREHGYDVFVGEEGEELWVNW